MTQIAIGSMVPECLAVAPPARRIRYRSALIVAIAMTLAMGQVVLSTLVEVPLTAWPMNERVATSTDGHDPTWSLWPAPDLRPDADADNQLSTEQAAALSALPIKLHASARGSTASGMTWDLATSVGGSEEEYSRAIAVDSSGNAYITGQFTSSSVTFGSDTLTLNASEDLFVAKLSGSGSWLWAVGVGGSRGDVGTDIAVDATGNAYVTGHFASDNLTFGATTLASNGTNADIFVASISASGTWLWATSVGGTSTDVGTGIAVDANSSVYVTGYFYSQSIDFGSSWLDNDGDYGDIFVSKYNATGEIQWVNDVEGDDEDESTGISVDSTGSVLVVGWFESSSVTVGTSTLNVAGNSAMLVARISASGSWQWARTVGGSAWTLGADVASGPNGTAVVTGHFSTSVTFPSSTLVSSGSRDIFVAQIGSTGSWQWAVATGGSGLEEAGGVAVDANGSIFVSGSFKSASLTEGATTVTRNGSNSDVLVAKLSATGNWEWLVSAGGTARDEAHAIALDAHGQPIVTGAVRSSSVIFDRTTLTGIDAHGDVFVAHVSRDADGDKWADLKDAFPGEPTQWADADGDGWGDNASGSNPDACPAVSGTSTDDRGGCPDGDGDGWSDLGDAFVNDSTQWTDQDGDGYGDNASGAQPDGCPAIAGNSTADQLGCVDSDGDGWSDDGDAFDDEPSQWEDQDGDGWGDNATGAIADDCPTVAGNSSADRQGCLDADGDGWSDAGDELPLDSTQWRDQDGDGFGDNLAGANGDDCPAVSGNSSADRFGCLDSDGDGWSDAGDAFPGDPTQWSDVDGDGWGDEPNGTHPDGCPSTNGTSVRDLYGCPDQDGDGWSDAGDAFDGDGTQHSDIDGDGWGDNATGLEPDACPSRHGTSTADRLGCPDADGDGVSDADTGWTSEDGADAFANESTQWSDTDGDGYGDNAGGIDPDDCPLVSGTSSIDRLGCPDADADGWSDMTDAFPNEATQWADADGDGWGDNPDGHAPDSCLGVNGTSFVDRRGCIDSDGDGVSDSVGAWLISHGADAFYADATQWADTDGDGWGDNPNGTDPDACPGVAGTSDVDRFGCADGDGDGWSDAGDECPAEAAETGSTRPGCPVAVAEREASGGTGVGTTMLVAGGSAVLLLTLVLAILTARMLRSPRGKGRGATKRVGPGTAPPGSEHETKGSQPSRDHFQTSHQEAPMAPVAGVGLQSGPAAWNGPPPGGMPPVGVHAIQDEDGWWWSEWPPGTDQWWYRGSTSDPWERQ